jgi:hypothetical protein
MGADKIETFRNGTPYVPAGGWATCFAWLIDFVTYLAVALAGAVLLGGLGRALDLGDGALGLAVIVWVLVAPLVCGLWYRNGRALGALCTGTRLVRLSDGGRIGAKGPWAMLVRMILMPLVIIAVVVGGGYADGTMQRASIDIARTRRLHAEGYPRRDAGQRI